MIYFTSDTHFCHNRDFLYSPRGFTNVADMNRTIIKNWNTVVTEDDEVYHLGDVMLNDNVEGIRCLKQLNGKIHIICGNHDTEERLKLYENCHNVVEVCYGRPLRFQRYHFFLSHYPTIASNFDYHKPLMQRTINLCGHSHTSDPFQDWDVGVIYHVELDAHNNYPISILDVLDNIYDKFAETH